MSDVLTIRPDMSTLLSHYCYHPGVDPENLERGDRAERGDRDACQLYSYYSLKVIQNFAEESVPCGPLGQALNLPMLPQTLCKCFVLLKEQVVCFSIAGKIFIAGGYDRGVHSDRASVECYDPDSDTWTFVTELEKARSGMTLATINGYIYALGGRNRSTDHYFDLAERYNPQTHQWQPIAPLNTPRAWPSVAVYDNKIFVLGGFDGAHRLSSVEVYDPDTDTWRFMQDMNTCRVGSGAAVL